MRYLTATLGAAAMVTTGTLAQAGGLGNEIMEAPVVVEEQVAPPAASSISPAFVVLGVLAALLLAANLQDDDDDEEDIDFEVSDIRLKEDIVHVGTTFNGLPIYTFKYLGEPGTYMGVMAQDVLMHTPEAVSVAEDGYMRVNYTMLGIGMVELQ